MKRILLFLLPTLLILSFLVFHFSKTFTPLNSKAQFGKQWKADMGIGTKEDRFARFDYEYQQLVDPVTKRIPPFMREKELMFAKTFSQNSKNRSADDLEWEHRGPYNIGGRTRAFVIDMDDENIMIAGSASGGLWKTFDAGANWTKVDNTGQNLSVTTIIQDPREGHHDEWYYGTGELFGASQSAGGAFFLGNGVYKSTDNGDTWESIPMTADNSPQSFTSAWEGIWRVAINPSNLDQTELYVCTYSTIYRSANGGDTWNSIIVTPLGGSVSYFTEIVFTSTGIGYAGLSHEDQVISFGLGAGGGVWRSQNGTDWVNILPDSFPPTYNRIVIGVNPSDENEVYFLADNVDTLFGKPGKTPLQDAQFNALWRYNYQSGDGTGEGGLWTELTDNLYVGDDDFDDFFPQSGYDLLVAVKPDEPNVVFVGGTNLYRSTDGFTTVENVDIIGGYAIGSNLPTVDVYENHHPDQHGVAFLPSNPDVMFSFNDGGVSRTDDCTNPTLTWTSLNNGYITTQFYTMAIDKTHSNETMMGGLQDNGTVYTSSSNPTDPWYSPLGADGSYCAIPDHGEYIIASTQRGRLAKVEITEQGEMLNFARFDPAIERDEFRFINPFVLDPNDNNILYLPATNKLWVNTDVGQYAFDNVFDSTMVGWIMHPDTLLINDLEFTAIGAAPNPSHRVYLGTNTKRVYRIDDATDPSSPLEEITYSSFPNGNVSCIAVHPNDGDNLFVVFSNYGAYSLYHSQDAGENWKRVAGNLEQGEFGSGSGPSLRWASMLPLNEDSTAYFVGTSIGLFYTETLDGLNTEWTKLSEDKIGSNIVNAIETRPLDGFVAVATHGNGAYSTYADLVPVGTKDIENVEVESIAAFPNPAKDFTTISFELKNAQHIKLELFDEIGRKIKTIVNEKKYAKGQHKIEVDLKNLAKGMYYYSIETENFKKTNALIIL